MGGNALKNTETRRVGIEEYDSITDELLEKLPEILTGEYKKAIPLREYLPAPREIPDSVFPGLKSSTNTGGVRMYRIPHYFKKESFGDIDFVCTEAQIADKPLHQWGLGLDFQTGVVSALREFGSKEVVANGSVISFEHRGVQIDLTFTNNMLAYQYLIYYAYNDLGNLLGKIAQSRGLKFGHRGLSWNLRDGDSCSEDICVSRDPEVIFKELGVSFDRWKQGFETLDDIFQFVASSTYFDPTLYLLENSCYSDRVRNKKRTTYMKFLGYCRERLDQTSATEYRLYKTYSEAVAEGPNSIRDFYQERSDSILPYLIENHPGFRDKYFDMTDLIYREKLFKEKFNGTIVSEITGLSGERLGEFMKYLLINNCGYIKTTQYSPERVRWLIRRYFQHWKPPVDN